MVRAEQERQRRYAPVKEVNDDFIGDQEEQQAMMLQRQVGTSHAGYHVACISAYRCPLRLLWAAPGGTGLLLGGARVARAAPGGPGAQHRGGAGAAEHDDRGA
eukprot:scaffold992_cov387-Prasinococcus_capsulatus_cf.AAC.6